MGLGFTRRNGFATPFVTLSMRHTCPTPFSESSLSIDAIGEVAIIEQNSQFAAREFPVYSLLSCG
jgi:hypothetical protein